MRNNTLFVVCAAALVVPMWVPGTEATDACPDARILSPRQDDVTPAVGRGGAVGVGYDVHVCHVAYFILVLSSDLTGRVLGAVGWAPYCSTAAPRHFDFANAFILHEPFVGPARLRMFGATCDGAPYEQAVTFTLAAVPIPA
jgi:hypothetical protein